MSLLGVSPWPGNVLMPDTGTMASCLCPKFLEFWLPGWLTTNHGRRIAICHSLFYNEFMLRWVRIFPFLLAALWLPVAATASVVMPFCQHAHQDAGLDLAESVSPDGQEDMACDHHAEPASQERCGYCYLACAGLMPVAAVMSDFLPPAREFTVAPASTFPRSPAEPLPRPPRTHQPS